MNFSVLRNQNELYCWRKQQKAQLGFVPTMGGLHNGHSQLIQTAKSSNLNDRSVVLVSVFVNPLQFGPKEDYNNYPRNIDQDIAIASKAGANAIWAPSINEIFPGGPDNTFKVQAPKKLQSQLCGSVRSGHFDGVATVMLHLLKHVQPSFLVLGEKDWQQLVILRQLIKDFGLPIKIRGVATVRDEDGLACSSRNQFLSPKERNISLALPKTLAKAAQQVLKRERLDLQEMRCSLEQKGLQVDYLEVVDPHKLQPRQTNQHFSLLAAAVRCGSTRLIDHTFLMTHKPIVAIDGPAGAGKSTVTRAFAKKLGLLYLDTGAMYRAVAWLINEKRINPKDEVAVKQALKGLELVLQPSKDNPKVIINGNQVTDAIRSPKITSIVSLIAAQKAVREELTSQQKAIGISGGLVAEGRDIGTAVFPNAELKIFLTATTAERARRRIIDLQHQGFSNLDVKEVEAQINKRDLMDSTREISPLTKAEDAIELITDNMDIQTVIKEIEELFRMKIPEEVWPSPAS